MEFSQISLEIQTPRSAWQLPLDTRQLMTVLSAMAERAVPDSSFEFILVDDHTISSLNASYLGCSGPTNIITFPASPKSPGSMYLSLDCLHRECLIYGQKPRIHLLRLLAHGFGHLAGLDHGTEMDSLAEACFMIGKQVLPDIS